MDKEKIPKFQKKEHQDTYIINMGTDTFILRFILIRNKFLGCGDIGKVLCTQKKKFKKKSYCHFWGSYSAVGKVGSCPRSPAAVLQVLNPYQQNKETKTSLHAQPVILATKQMPANVMKQNYSAQVTKRCVGSIAKYIWICHCLSYLIQSVWKCQSEKCENIL